MMLMMIIIDVLHRNLFCFVPNGNDDDNHNDNNNMRSRNRKQNKKIISVKMSSLTFLLHLLVGFYFMSLLHHTLNMRMKLKQKNRNNKNDEIQTI